MRQGLILIYSCWLIGTGLQVQAQGDCERVGITTTTGSFDLDMQNLPASVSIKFTKADVTESASELQVVSKPGWLDVSSKGFPGKGVTLAATITGTPANGKLVVRPVVNDVPCTPITITFRVKEAPAAAPAQTQPVPTPQPNKPKDQPKEQPQQQRPQEPLPDEPEPQITTPDIPEEDPDAQQVPPPSTPDTTPTDDTTQSATAPDPNPTPVWLYGLAGVLGLVVLLVLLRVLGRSNPAAVPAKPATQPTAPKSTPPLPDKPPVQESGSTSIVFSNTTPKPAESVPAGQFPEADRLTREFYPVDLTTYWADTAIRALYIHQGCARAISDYVEQSRATAFSEGEEVVEIGGFLLGQYRETPAGYLVTLDTFVQSTSNRQNVYAVSFDTEAMIQLDDALTDRPHLKAVGWFHTHPGHGLFLSKPDLNIHEGFFRMPFQVAMEIDSLTDRLDVAFFVRSQSGVLNNYDKRLTSEWLAWKEVEAWLTQQENT